MKRLFIKENNKDRRYLRYKVFLGAVFILQGVVADVGALETITYTATHTFSINDVIGGFDGSTYGPEGTFQDTGLICGPGFTVDPCPADSPQPFEDKSGTTLFPVDSEFGFYVADFVGAAQKVRDDIYAEGWVGNVLSNGVSMGLMVSNAATDTFKVASPLGTWCAGLGGNKVKCSTEHFVVVEHIKTCNETIPYMWASSDGEQSPLYDPATGEAIAGSSCAEGALDNDMFLIVDGAVTGNPLLADEDTGFPIMEPNEEHVRNDIATGRDYSITKKDDGKPLYRFGSMIKRPNDIRLYARMSLPQEWKDNPENAYPVSGATLEIDHLITNNPNDQIRPEDMENEDATGRLPGYIDVNGLWVSDTNCYEGDGDFIPAGTKFKTPGFAYTKKDPLSNNPVPYSEDLREGYTNAWYTTTDRDPFEADPISEIGPRWRLKANKFGQDLPGLEIPSVNCMATPYTSKFKKYEVGQTTTTVLNLLDFAGDSPLLTSQGWIKPNGINELALDGDGNEIVVIQDNGLPLYLSVNGLPLSEDFDLAVYVKGDRKPTAVYNARLMIKYEGEGGGTVPVDDSFDLAIDSFRVPKKIFGGSAKNFKTYLTNLGPEVANGELIVECSIESTGGVIDTLSIGIGAVAPGEEVKIVTPWTAPNLSEDNVPVTCLATINAEGDTNAENNTGAGATLIRLPRL